MKNSLLLDLLRKLDSSQLRRLGLFVGNKLHNSHQPTQKLIQLVLDQGPEFKAEKLDRIVIWKKLYPTKPFRDRSFNNLTSDALQLCYDFLSYENWRAKSNQYYDNLTEALLNLGLTEQANRSLRRWSKTADKNGLAGDQEQYGQYRRLEHQDQLAILEKRRYTDFLQQKNDALDEYYLNIKLQIACAMASRSRIVQGSYRNNLLVPLVDHFQSSLHEATKTNTASIYWRTYQLLQEENPEENFQWLKTKLQDQAELFSAAELNGLYQYLINYCIRKINSGDSYYYREVLQLYQIQLQGGILFKSGEMTEWTYANIVTTSLRLKEFAWANDFIESYRSYLPKGKQYNVYNYNLAALRFAQGEDDKALQQLLTVEFTDAFYYVAAKIILLKIYYRQGAYEALLSQSESARLYLIRNRQLAENQRKSNKKFLQFLVKITQLQFKQIQLGRAEFNKRMAKIRQELTESPGVSNRVWLMEILTNS